MPKPNRQPLEFSRAELRESRVALAEQLDTLTQLDAAAYGRHIQHSYSALARVLQRLGQEPGEKCFLCRKPLVAASSDSATKCPDGCDSPGGYLRRIGRCA